MKIFMVARGAQGDVYPYFQLAKALTARGHVVTISVSEEFRKLADEEGFHYLVQAGDDITGMVANNPNVKDLLAWMRDVVAEQFKEYIPVLRENDCLIASNTEFGAPHVGEYCKKPVIRTAYAPLVPSKSIYPPMFPIVHMPRFPRPMFYWKMINRGLNMMMLKNINRERAKLGMAPIKDQGEYAPAMSENVMIYSPNLGEVDREWKYRWHATGYCFNDSLNYDEALVQKALDFVRRDDRPTLFFTFGSCQHKRRDLICQYLYEICLAHNWKLAVGAGWFHTGEPLLAQGTDYCKDLLILEGILPHKKLLPFMTAIIHHGGSGTTHSCARAGRPQMALPLLIDQFYWASRVEKLGCGPATPGVKASKAKLEKRVVDLMTNPAYKDGALALAAKINAEDGLDAFCDYIERVVDRHA